MTAAQTVFVVDDDPAMRESLRWLLEPAGLNVETFESAQAFLDSRAPERSGCLVLDMRLPDMSGLDLQSELLARRSCLPVIMITGHADVPIAVRALKGGAIDFIEKPFNGQRLLEGVRQAVERDRQTRRRYARQRRLAGRVARLSPRERQVMDLVVQGKANKVIAVDLGLSQKTVEIHRGHVMQKMRARSVADLVRMALRAKRALNAAA